MKAFWTLTTLVLTLSISGCVSDSKPNNNERKLDSDSFDFISMFANYADNIIIPNYKNVADNARLLATDSGPLATYCASLGTGDEATAQAAAQSTWKTTMDHWQRAELHQLGPVLDNNATLRNRIYTYGPNATLSTCGIDQAVVLAANDPNFDLRNRATNQRGLSALEYLLFTDDLTHSCPAQITETNNWNNRPELERKQLRCNYARALSQDLASAASDIVNAWLPGAGDYRTIFINPTNTQTNLSALSDGLFYLDTDTKDVKLGIPTGINAACSQFSCPTLVESSYANYSFSNIEKNLESFQTLLTGGNGLGFDDMIAQAGVPEVTRSMKQDIANALAIIASTPESLLAQVNSIDSEIKEDTCTNAYNNPDASSTLSVCTLYGHVKRITDQLKVGFVAAVDVDLPDRAQSDND